MFKITNVNEYDNEQIKRLLASKIGAFGSNFFVPLIFYIGFYNILSNTIFSVWIVAQMIVYAFRSYIAYRALDIIAYADKKMILKYFKFYLSTIFANSFLWGLASILVIQYADMTYLFIYYIGILGLSAASISTLGAVFYAILIFISNSMLIIALSLLILGSTPIHYLLAFFAFLYLFIVLPTAFKNYKYFNDSMKQKEEIKILNSYLKQNNGLLKEQIHNFQNLLDTTMEMIVISHNGIIKDVNFATMKILGVSTKEELIGRNIIDFVPKSEYLKMQQALENSENEEREAFEFKILSLSGEIIPTLASGKYIQEDGERLRISTFLDLTKIKRQEQQLYAQSRLAQMGEMISMIAHQWRQPLGAISTTAVNLKLKLELETFDLDSKEGLDEAIIYFLERLENIEAYVHTLTTTIDDFRNFYKPNKHSVSTKLESVVKKSLNVIQSSLDGDGIEVLQEYNEKQEIEIYDSELMQVILNVLKNAQDNFKEKNIENPKISIKTEDRTVVICDNGEGISEEIIEKIFDPYFSTKDERNGTGLGLYMSKQIVEEHHKGSLVAKNMNEGICFVIKLKASVC